ncbi:HtaA domain-containing protein [Trueperella pecoris]|uniref:HtaA domain-containing protein n=1 Tax=Trueperella pecoris TaxID=2733571 RepID=A0A7M1QWB5_9ACTO|nr:HtaA domain-containing protein [Trueperella pecoris]QOR46392.1 HtaA domain-containing protein [Trueperella pecoris]QTG76217.1 HtaA domain-containing protein [Trueperella pecoris]
MKRIAAAATLALSLVAGSCVPAFAADKVGQPVSKAQNKEVEVADTYANWDFRRSFREYVGTSWEKGVEEGERLEGGVQLLEPKSHLMWKARAGQKLDLGGAKGQLHFDGKVSWRKYGGILDVWIANPTIDFEKKQILVDGYTKGTMAKAGVVEFKQTAVASLEDLKIEDRGDYAVISSAKTILNDKVSSLVGFYKGEEGAPFVATVPLKKGQKAPQPVLWKIFPKVFPDPTAKPGPAYSGNPTKEVRLPDEGLRKCIHEQFDIKSEMPITNTDLEGVRVLNCQVHNIKSLEGLQYAINLESVNFFRNEITDLSPLAQAHKLARIDVRSNYLTDLHSLKGLKNVEELKAQHNLLKDISAVQNMPKLYRLELDYNLISDITQLPVQAKLDGALDTLTLSHNKISDLSKYKDVAPVALEADLSFNQISDLGTLAKSEKVVEKLNLKGNKLTDATQLVDGPLLKKLESLDVTGNPFTTWKPLEEYKQIIRNFPKLNDNGEPLEKVELKAKPHDEKSTADREKGLQELVKKAEALKATYLKSEKEIADQQAKRNAAKPDAKKEQAPAGTESKTDRMIGLNWGLKESFRNYVSGDFAQGKWDLSDGATGTFTFPLKDPKQFTVDKFENLDFAGKVHFTAHHGLLDLAIEQPTVHKGNSGWELVVTVAVNPFDKSKIADVLAGKITMDKSKIVTKRVTLATLGEPEISGSNGDQTIRFNTVKLTAEGANSFANFYQVGQELDPITISATAVKANDADKSKKDEQSAPKDKADTNTPRGEAPKGDNTAGGKTTAKQCVVDPHKKRITQGTLNWGLRSSFTTYIRGAIAHGKWDLNGASWDGSNFNFPASGGTFNTQTKAGTVYYSGSVHFTGHDGVLDLTISRPSLEIKGNTGALYMNVVGSDMSGNKFDLGRVHFANAAINKLSATDKALSFSASSVTLTAAGAKAFAGFYKAGEALAPLSGTATLVPATSCDPKTGELVEFDAFGKKLAHTGAELPAIILAALTMLVVGTGLVVSRRRELDSAIKE